MPIFPQLEHFRQRRLFISVQVSPARARRMLAAYREAPRLVASLRFGILAPATFRVGVEAGDDGFPRGHFA